MRMAAPIPICTHSLLSATIPEPVCNHLSAALYRRSPPGAGFGFGGGTPLSAKK